jgi:hypothetical protein
MLKKAILIIILFNLLGLLSSCFNVCDGVKYYDFDKAYVHAPNPEVKRDEEFTFTLDYDLYYFATLNNFFYNSAYALSCANPGWGGSKNPVVKIEITSDADFNENYPANSLLNDIVEFFEDYPPKYIPLDQMDFSRNFGIWLSIRNRPTKSNEHTFYINIYKADGQVITTNSEKITWL